MFNVQTITIYLLPDFVIELRLGMGVFSFVLFLLHLSLLTSDFLFFKKKNMGDK